MALGYKVRFLKSCLIRFTKTVPILAEQRKMLECHSYHSRLTHVNANAWDFSYKWLSPILNIKGLRHNGKWLQLVKRYLKSDSIK